MKVYDIFLERRDVFVFYQAGEEWVPISHPTKFIPCGAGIWDPEKKNFSPTTCRIDRIAVPTFRVAVQDLPDYIDYHAQAVLQNIAGLGGDELDRYNIIIPQKHIENDYIEIGLFGRNGIGESVNERADRLINKQLKFKAFW